MSIRPVVFWLHLLVGVTAGTVIAFMSVTGVLLAFEPQITEWLERDRRIVVPPPGAARLPVETLVARAREARPDVRPSIVTLRADPTAALVVSFGRDGGALFVDPYRGMVLGGCSRVHDFLHEVVEWHRWLGSREIARPITGAANLGFLGLVSLGVFLWWPRRLDARDGAGMSRCSGGGLRGRARDFNWHNVIGIWCAPVLLVLTLTGVDHVLPVGQQPPRTADRLRAPAAAGAERPRRRATRPGARASDVRAAARPAERRAPARLDALWARAERSSLSV